MKELSVGEYGGGSIFLGPWVMYVVVGEPFVNTWEFINCFVYVEVLVFNFDFLLKISNGHVMFCGGMMAC